MSNGQVNGLLLGWPQFGAQVRDRFGGFLGILIRHSG